jgi:hypothetical protein
MVKWKCRAPASPSMPENKSKLARMVNCLCVWFLKLGMCSISLPDATHGIDNAALGMDGRLFVRVDH